MTTHEESEQQVSILAAKVVILEKIVRALLKDKLQRDAADPIQAAQSYRDRINLRSEQTMQGGPHDPATVLMTENTDLFFDALIRDLTAGRGQQS